MKQYEPALADLAKALELNPRWKYDIYVLRGSLYYAMGKPDLALDDYNRSLSLEPRYARAYFERGLVYAATGKYDQALKDFDTALAMSEENYRVYLHKGAALEKNRPGPGGACGPMNNSSNTRRPNSPDAAKARQRIAALGGKASP
jgi:tetratricopeptide (TPR) repeat protein